MKVVLIAIALALLLSTVPMLDDQEKTNIDPRPYVEAHLDLVRADGVTVYRRK